MRAERPAEVGLLAHLEGQMTRLELKGSCEGTMMAVRTSVIDKEISEELASEAHFDEAARVKPTCDLVKAVAKEGEKAGEGENRGRRGEKNRMRWTKLPTPNSSGSTASLTR